MASRLQEALRDGIIIAEPSDHPHPHHHHLHHHHHHLSNGTSANNTVGNNNNHHLHYTSHLHGPSTGVLVQRPSASPVAPQPSPPPPQVIPGVSLASSSSSYLSQQTPSSQLPAISGPKSSSDDLAPMIPSAPDTSNTLSPIAVLACLAYAAASTLVTLLNKVVFSHSRFHYPWTTLAVQNILSVLLIEAGHVAGATRAGRYSTKLARDMTIPVFYFVLFIFTNAQCTRYISIPVLTVWKSLGPMFVTLFERSYFGDVFSSRVYAAMVLIVLSALVTAINDLEYSLVGYLWAAGNVVANVAYLASLRIYLRAPGVSALDKTFHSNLISLLPMVVLAYATDETPDVIKDFRTTSVWFKIVFVLSGFLTTAVCATAFWVISLTNGSTLSFIGGMNKIPMILLSLLMFETRMSWAGWFGVFLGVIAGIVFMRAKSIVPQAYAQGQAAGIDSAPAKDMYGKRGDFRVPKSGTAHGSASAGPTIGKIGRLDIRDDGMTSRVTLGIGKGVSVKTQNHDHFDGHDNDEKDENEDNYKKDRNFFDDPEKEAELETDDFDDVRKSERLPLN